MNRENIVADQSIDKATIGELKQVMGDEFPLLIDTFNSDSAVRLQAIREGIAAADPEAVRLAAHSFKGSAGNLGAAGLTDLCQQLETQSMTGQLTGGNQLLTQIELEYEQVKSALAGV